MSIRITRSSAEAKREAELNRVHCPECNSEVYFGTYHYEGSGFLKLKDVKVLSYNCHGCGCQFEQRK